MKVGKVVRVVKSPARRVQKAGQKPIPVVIPKKEPKKVENV